MLVREIIRSPCVPSSVGGGADGSLYIAFVGDWATAAGVPAGGWGTLVLAAGDTAWRGVPATADRVGDYTEITKQV